MCVKGLQMLVQVMRACLCQVTDEEYAARARGVLCAEAAQHRALAVAAGSHNHLGAQ